ncbi:MAG: PD40 domain-containing protein [Anaerolineae bacterium]|nr:PD40 domain-containing protein [Anaerolineae bacterium]
MKKLTPFLLTILLLSLAACSTASGATLTPTIVRLDRGELAQAATSTAEAVEPTSTTEAAEPTATNTTVAASPTATEAIETADPTATSAATAATTAVTPTSSATTTATASAVAQVEIVTPAINLRSGPGMDYDSIGTAQEGEQLDVTGVSASKVWLQVITADGKTAWVSASTDFVRLISAEIDDLPVVEAGSSATGATQQAASASFADVVATETVAANTSGGQLVFATSSGGDLYIVNLDGTGLQKLASGVIDPIVSPDGTQVAYTRWESSEWGAVYTFSLVDGVERVVYSDILQPKSPTWSPDGQKLVVSFQQGGVRDPKEECRRYDFGERVRIPENSTITSTTYNGDKSKTIVCFVRNEDLQWLLTEIDVATGERQDLPSDLYSFAPAWDPENPQRVIYEGIKGLMQLDLSTGSNTALTTDAGDTAPIFSSDGQTLLMTYKQHDHWEVYTYNLASGARERLTKPPLMADPQYSSAAPTWSPDGSQIAFLTDRTGQWEIWVMNVDGSDPQPLFSPEVQGQLGLQYNGVNEQLLNWIGSTAPVSANASPDQLVSIPTVSAPTEETLPANTALTGDWDFSFGTMSLTQRSAVVDGTYSWYGSVDTGTIDGIVLDDLSQFQGLWISDRNSDSQQLLRWKIAPDYNSFTGSTTGGMNAQQWCGVRSGQPLPDGCGFSGSWQLHFASPVDMTGQATLVQTGATVQGTFVDSEGHSGEITGVVTVASTTEVMLSGTWSNDQGQQDTFEWHLDLTTGRTFQGRRDPGNSEWCGWREGTDEPVPCGWED